MPNRNDDKSRVSKSMTKTVLSGMSKKMDERVVNRRMPSGLMGRFIDNDRRQRMELLDLTNSEDETRWQMLHNDSERYEVITSKFSTVRADKYVDYTCLVIYYEIGEDLPLVKSQFQLRVDDQQRMVDEGYGVPDMSGSNFRRGRQSDDDDSEFTLEG